MKLFETPKKKTQINITALVDILFLLIIFFAVSTQFTNQRSIGVDLPRSETGNSISTLKKLMLLMKEEGEVFVNGERVSMENLEDAIRQGDFDTSRRVILNIDRQISHGTVIRILDILKQLKFKKVVFGTYAGK